MSVGHGRRAATVARPSGPDAAATKPSDARTGRNGSILQQPRLPGAQTILSRFGPILGRRFAKANLGVLGQAHAAFTGLRKARALRGRGVNIFTQWIGDPDALGSSVLLKA